MKLIVFKGSYTDACDVCSHLILNKEQEQILNRIQKFSEEEMMDTDEVFLPIYEGNDLMFDNVYEVYQSLEIHEIKQEEAKTIQKYFGETLGVVDIDDLLRTLLDTLLGGEDDGCYDSSEEEE